MKQTEAVIARFAHDTFDGAFQFAAAKNDAIAFADPLAGTAEDFPRLLAALLAKGRREQNFYFACCSVRAFETAFDARADDARIIKDENIGRVQEIRQTAEFGIRPLARCAIQHRHARRVPRARGFPRDQFRRQLIIEIGNVHGKR